MRALFLAAALTLPGAALAQAPAPALPPADAAAPAPAYDPETWWSGMERRPDERFDPLGQRRWRRDDRVLDTQRAPEAGLYRLWGLVPLQTQAVRRGDMILEVWVRPTADRPSMVVRVTVRSDGEVFAQGRAGYACCRPDIQRRVDADIRLPRSVRDSLTALRRDPLWSQPEHVVVRESADAISSLCVQGTSYDLYLAADGRAIHRRRSCDDAEVGSAAAVLEALFGAVRGQDPRIDAAMPRNGNFQRERAYWAEFSSSGGVLAPDTSAPSDPPAPEEQPPEAAGAEPGGEPAADAPQVEPTQAPATEATAPATPPPGESAPDNSPPVLPPTG